MEKDNYKKHQTTTKYWICKKKFLNQALLKTIICCLNTGNYIKALYKGQILNQGLLKVRDHDHINDKYKGSAHNNYNKKLQMDEFKIMVSLICHNFQSYNFHLLIKFSTYSNES
ncbi:hypothetical protein Glove_460g40 [Diversispora epigaea]|uniref:Uncharacterized protein n=1 Tax=Diversispora epigaea TaxID=1348612 RepID=A0A397GNZ6_9GLOM|nr:hypothetical protein Glove_460g40 [Diversispora epigaea]